MATETNPDGEEDMGKEGKLEGREGGVAEAGRVWGRSAGKSEQMVAVDPVGEKEAHECYAEQDLQETK